MLNMKTIKEPVIAPIVPMLNVPTVVYNPSDWTIRSLEDDKIEATMGTYRFVGTMIEFNSLMK